MKHSVVWICTVILTSEHLSFVYDLQKLCKLQHEGSLANKDLSLTRTWFLRGPVKTYMLVYSCRLGFCMWRCVPVEEHCVNHSGI